MPIRKLANVRAAPLRNNLISTLANFHIYKLENMIFEVKKEQTTYIVDDLKLFDQQAKAFKMAFSEAEKENAEGVIIAHFDNSDAILYTLSNRVLISLKEVENENN